MGKLTENSDMQLNDAVVWVTGASSGIGKALVKALADNGAKVILSARKASSLSAVVKEYDLDEDKTFILPLDLEQPGTFPDRVQAAIAHWGRVDVLVNNGGISQRSLAKDTSMEVVKR